MKSPTTQNMQKCLRHICFSITVSDFSRSYGESEWASNWQVRKLRDGIILLCVFKTILKLKALAKRNKQRKTQRPWQLGLKAVCLLLPKVVTNCYSTLVQSHLLVCKAITDPEKMQQPCSYCCWHPQSPPEGQVD